MGDSPLSGEFKAFSGRQALEQASWSVYIRDVTSGTDILSHNADMLLVPASTQKLLTTATALMMLGSDYRFETHLEHDGEIDRQGVLNGNIYIMGGGDPSFGATQVHDSLALEHVFIQWQEALQYAGIKEISGHIIADASLFDDEMVPRRYLWEDVGNYFGAGASGLSVHENEYTVFFDGADAVGGAATVLYTQPFIPSMELVNEVLTGPAGSGDQVYIYGGPFMAERRLTGTVPLRAKSFPVRGSLHDPPQYVADELILFLRNEAGIPVKGIASTIRNAPDDGIIPSAERRTLHTWHSPSLFDIVYRTNLASVNSYAEHLIKILGHNYSGEGSYRAGLTAINELWESRKALTMPLSFLQDGSGLSPANRLSARQLMEVMQELSGDPSFGVLLYSLPLAGYSGSLAPHLRGRLSEGRLRAKSGFMSHVMGYAGYTPMQNGNLAAFVILINHYEGTPAGMRQAILHLMDSISHHDGSPVKTP